MKLLKDTFQILYNHYDGVMEYLEEQLLKFNKKFL